MDDENFPIKKEHAEYYNFNLSRRKFLKEELEKLAETKLYFLNEVLYLRLKQRKIDPLIRRQLNQIFNTINVLSDSLAEMDREIEKLKKISRQNGGHME